MAHNPKLEIYKIRLFEKETGTSIPFRKFLAHKLNYYGRKEERVITKTDTAKMFFKDFIEKIDNKYHINEKKKKSFKISNKGFAAGKIIPGYDSLIFRGVLDGGPHGRKRYLGDVTDAASETNIGTNNIVGDSFYFLLHFSLEHDEGVVFIQGYSGATISDIFRGFLEKYFTFHKEFKSELSFFVPKSLKDKYLDQAVFKSVEFSSGWHIDETHDGTPIPQKYEVQVKVEIVDKSQRKTTQTGFASIIKEFSNFVLQRGKEEKPLEKFKKKAKMESNGKLQPIDLTNISNIKPVLFLEQVGINVQEGLLPDFEQIDAYCTSILPDVMKEILPSNEIKDL